MSYFAKCSVVAAFGFMLLAANHLTDGRFLTSNITIAQDFETAKAAEKAAAEKAAAEKAAAEKAAAEKAAAEKAAAEKAAAEKAAAEKAAAEKAAAEKAAAEKAAAEKAAAEKAAAEKAAAEKAAAEKAAAEKAAAEKAAAEKAAAEKAAAEKAAAEKAAAEKAQLEADFKKLTEEFIKKQKQALDQEKELAKKQKDIDALKAELTKKSVSAATGEAPRVKGVNTPPIASIVDQASFWTVENSKTLDLYRMEPRIKEATTILGDVLAQAAAQAQTATTPAELEAIPGKFRDMFLVRLRETDRTELTIQTWRNAANQWFLPVNAKLEEAADQAAYQKVLVTAFSEGAQKAVPWGVAIDAAHHDNRGKAAGGDDAGTAGGTSSGGQGSISSGQYSGYLPPLAAYHHAKHVRRVSRLQARIQLYGGR